MLRPGELELNTNLPPNGCSPAEAQSYTRWLATHHYENFNVVSWLLPKELHQHFYNVYAYCRWADDLGDEIPETARALELLDWWERELDLCYEGRPSHPVFVALRETAVAKDIPRQPFANLLKAFRQDQTVKRYPDWPSVLHYCVYSANPVGHLVLYLCGYRDAERQRLSDATCTALQLANFWQDVSRDLDKGRIYIPLDIAANHSVSEEDIVQRRCSNNYVALMKELIARTRALFHEGLPLANMVDDRLRIDIEMFSRGGLAVLDAIEAQGYDTLHRRPSIGKAKQAQLLARSLLAHLLAKARSRSAPVGAQPCPERKRMDVAPQLATDASSWQRSDSPRVPHVPGSNLGLVTQSNESVGARHAVPVSGPHLPLSSDARVPQVRLLNLGPTDPSSDTAAEARAHSAPWTSSPSSDVSDSYAACHRLARAARSNFYYAFYLLPKPKRDGLAALYAFMRMVDDIADDRSDLATKQRGLARWRTALDQAATGQEQLTDGNAAVASPTAALPGADEILPALADTMRRFNIPARYLHDHISGAEMDLTLHAYPTFDRLKEYCYRVAGTVGITCTHIFGFRDPRALDLADKLGLAFQLTNIIRDVHEDYGLGRVYLPDEDLLRYSITAEMFGHNEITLGIRELLRFEAERAWLYYDEGSALLDLIDSDSRATLWLLVHTYSALLARIESLDFAVFGERVRLSKAEKMLFIARARFGRLTRENIVEIRNRDRRRPGGTGGRRRAG
jgi:squalene synthase HpnC